MIYDSMKKNVTITVRIVNGKVSCFYGGELPDINDGTIGELIIPEYAIKDKNFVAISQCEESIEILPHNSILMFAISKNNIPIEKRNFISIIGTEDHKYDSFVEAKLLEPLELQLRGSKKSTLLNARCTIPSLKKEAISINHAYTLISEAFEPERNSHTGNVFDKCYYKNKDMWFPLENLRNNEESKYEEKLFLDNKVFILKRDCNKCYIFEKFERNKFSEKELLLIDFLVEYKHIKGFHIKKLYDCIKKEYITIINDLYDKDIICESEK